MTAASARTQVLQAEQDERELFEARDAIATWARLAYAFIAHAANYKAAFMASLGRIPSSTRRTTPMP